MAQHVEVSKLLEEDKTQYTRKAIESIQKRIAYLRGLYMPSSMRHLRINNDLRIFGKTMIRLPEDFAPEGYLAFNAGSYKVSQKLVWGGQALFEVHYNPDTRHTIIYMVA